MSDSLETIAGFLLRFQDEVGGRETPTPPPPEVMAEMRAMVEGALDEERRTLLAQKLRGEPVWVEFLAELVKNNKTGEEDASAHE
ncbi:MAG: hypothetical protein ACI8UO_006035 [Verrucomicrobiales bacterium]|jgi:hypothetical protein